MEKGSLDEEAVLSRHLDTDHEEMRGCAYVSKTIMWTTHALIK